MNEMTNIDQEEIFREAVRRIRELEDELQAWKAAADNGCGCDTPEGLAAFINCCNCQKQPYNNSMNEKQTVWVVTEIVEEHDNCPSFEIIGVYTENSIAREIYNRSVNYYIDEVELNK